MSSSLSLIAGMSQDSHLSGLGICVSLLRHQGQCAFLEAGDLFSVGKTFTSGPDAGSLQVHQASGLCACFGENEYLSLTV